MNKSASLLNSNSFSVLYEEVSSSYPNIAQTFSHIYVVDVMWLQVLKGNDMQEALEASIAFLEKINLYSADEFVKANVKLASQYEEWSG